MERFESRSLRDDKLRGDFAIRNENQTETLALIAAVTPQHGVEKGEGLSVGARWREEYERIAGNSS
ncbi:hypothetical protein AMQ68_23485 [Chryseobacterium sp. ERMR1:04]|nr:hypothetical protein AMQ68_23485 [Chryseobacterium sp. ERMR1:04]